MSMTARDDDTDLRMFPAEPDSVKIARIEEAIGGIREDVADIKADVRAFGHKISYLEDVRVRGLEDREVRAKAIADERARAADTAREIQHKQIDRRTLWLTTLIIAAVTILAALIASGHLF